MQVVRTVKELRQAVAEARREGRGPVGFVPTMGFLHEGHASLLRRAGEQSGTVVLSIFVNPLQFGPNEDYEAYPRNESRDLELAEREGTDIVFMPGVDEMYPKGAVTKVTVSRLTDRLCGASRPGHFDGVTTVVSKLFHMVEPDFAFFGQKDAQQVAVIRQMVDDLNMNVEIVPCPIVRETDGLALSSRNVYLSPEERSQALVLSQALAAARTAVAERKAVTAAQAKDLLASVIGTSALADMDYAELLTFPGLEPVGEDERLYELQGEIIMALAVRFGRTRLIDNVIFSPKEEPAYV